jgi:uncharacterized protein YbbC (DUF1343 family)
LTPTTELFKACKEIKLVALFAPEHGIHGAVHAAGHVAHKTGAGGLPIYSLHGETRRPTEQMLKAIDVLVYDIQDIGVRSYTYATTLFYAMEEAAKKGVRVIVLDRPNPINGIIVDGPMLQEEWRSFIGYINVPYCHGMTIGELAQFFNEEYHIGCDLRVVPMKGWKRTMNYADTGLAWVPPSPQIPESDTPLFCASTGLLGELQIVSIGVGYTLPFKVVGAPWIRAEEFAEKLNAQRLPGVRFIPFYYRPFFGSFKDQECQGVKIIITNPHACRPLSIQYLLLGMLKTLYPKQIEKKLSSLNRTCKNLFCQASGNDRALSLLQQETYIAWKLIEFQQASREAFLLKREQYLLY